MPQVVLRTSGWDGQDPQQGAVVQHPDHGPLLVTLVAKGPGVGHWRLECTVPQLIAWHP